MQSCVKDIKTLNPRPSERYKQIVKNNRDHIAKNEDNNKTENNSLTWNQVNATINSRLQQNPNIIVTVR